MIVIVGGGVIGSSIAYFLKTLDPALPVTVIERDPSYARSSSALSAASIRQQFSTDLSIRMSLFGIEFLRDIDARLRVDDTPLDIGLREAGYLFLATPDGEAILRDNHALQTRLGADIRYLPREALAQRFDWLNTDDLAAGAWGATGEGWFDGYGLVQALRRKAVASGVRYLAHEVTGVSRRGRRVTAVTTDNGERHPCDVLVNAAGPWARALAAMLSIDLPVYARRRSVFVFSSPARLEGCPLVIDPGGAYFRPEGAHYIGGISPPADQDRDDLPLDVDYALFDEVLWPTFAHRVPAFEALRLETAWSGYYEYNVFDHNAVIGPHPDIDNCVFANGFSGHGLQHGPATGRGVAEWIVHGGYRSLDLSPLGFERVLSQRPIVERNVV